MYNIQSEIKLGDKLMCETTSILIKSKSLID